MDIKRTNEFRRNIELEKLLADINSNLKPVEETLAVEQKQRYPIIFIMGASRSGTTLMTQWLAATKEISYPTNMLSRFYEAPIMGAKIQRLLTDPKYNYRNEILDFNTPLNYLSENGKTRGALAPNEFWYFWRRFLKYDTEVEYISNEDLLNSEEIDYMKRELIGISEVFERPFALKGMICNNNIEALDKIFDKAIFIYVKRNPYTNVESLLGARKKQLGDINKWYSFKIPEYPELIKIENPVKQVAAQVYHVNKAVAEGIEKVADNRKVIVEYEDFCDNPEKYYQILVKKLLLQGCNISHKYIGEKSFYVSRENVNVEIERCYNEYVREVMDY